MSLLPINNAGSQHTQIRCESLTQELASCAASLHREEEAQNNSVWSPAKAKELNRTIRGFLDRMAWAKCSSSQVKSSPEMRYGFSVSRGIHLFEQQERQMPKLSKILGMIQENWPFHGA